MKKQYKRQYKEYWKRNIGYDFEQEFNIYKYLCGNMRRKKQVEKVPVDKRFITYSAWNEYVKKCYDNKNLDELKEFYRYLNSLSRGDKSLDTVSKTLVIPLYMVIVTDNLFPEILKKDWTSWKTVINDVVEIFSIANGVGEKIFVVVAVLMIFIIAVLIIILFLGGPVLLVVMQGSLDIFKSDLIKGFHNDYLEIIENIISQKEKMK